MRLYEAIHLRRRTLKPATYSQVGATQCVASLLRLSCALAKPRFFAGALVSTLLSFPFSLLIRRGRR